VAIKTSPLYPDVHRGKPPLLNRRGGKTRLLIRDEEYGGANFGYIKIKYVSILEKD
jgi:hypothetical protein